MASLEVENICSYLKSKEIQISANNSWLNNCINWYKSHFELRNVYGSLQEYVCVQWLLADLQDVQQGSLPTNCKDGVIELNGKYNVQINWVRDIGQSCYSQLKAIQDTSASESNENVSADDPKKQSWEPNTKRVLMMEVTDGITCLKAMEYSPIQKLLEPFLPGFKVVLIGPIECRKGIMFLKNDNIILLGGEVQELYYINSKQNLLSRCLNLTTNCANGNQDRTGTANVTNHSHSENILQPRITQTYSNPISSNSRTHIEQNTLIQSRDREMLMDLEDDDFLCQLPDEVLDCPRNFDPDSHELSPVLDRQSPINSRMDSSSTINVENDNVQSHERSPVLISKPLLVDKPKPKLFPSLDDLSSDERDGSSSSNICKNVPPSISKDISKNSNLPANSFSSISRCTRQFEKPSTTSINTENEVRQTVNTFQNNTLSSSSFNSYDINMKESLNKRHDGRKNEHLLQDETEHLIELMDTTITEDLKYPELKTVRTKIKSIKKLKIRNSEWICEAIVSFENNNQSVTFSNNVLEKVFGISAPEVEVWRGEMANNPSLKKKVNDILKAGQAKLNTLDCMMVLEYTSDKCTPNVVETHLT